jgi:hypothetical protein
MVAYSFKQQFVAPILSGAKSQTIRADRKRHAAVGETISLYTGMRTKACRLIGLARCFHLMPIRIDVETGRIENPSGFALTTIEELDHFAQKDGFRAWPEMRAFWQVNHPGVEVFDGVLIRWDQFSAA